MSDITFSDLRWITREDLASSIKSASSGGLPAHMAVVDVRDSDHIGGHIRGSTWVPSSELDFKTPELVRTLRDKEVVVFHCALSQQRGPSAALRYLREKRRLDPESGVVSQEAGEKKDEGEGKKGEGEGNSEENEREKGKKQKVVVLRGGFTEWQDKYGEDTQLTEAYQKDIWEFGY